MSNASNLFEGEFQAKAVKPEFGSDNRGRPKIRVEMEIVDGDRKGARVPYDGKLDADAIKYTKRDMIALGWAGKDVRTFVDDVLKAGKVVPITTRIARFDPQDGRPVREWTSVGRIGGAPPLAPIASDKIGDVNQWFAEAPELDAPQNGAGRDSDIPF